MRSWSQLGSIFGRFWVSWEGLGASWDLLGASWGRLRASWPRLRSSEPSWAPLGGVLSASWAPKNPQEDSAVPGMQLCCGPGGTLIFKDEQRLHAYRRPTDLYRPPYTIPDTQLGAFGPGADPKRSRAAYPPPRLTCKSTLKSILN